MHTDGEKNDPYPRLTDRPEPPYTYPDSDPLPAYRTDSPGPSHAPHDQGPVYLGRRPRDLPERLPPATDRPSSTESPPEKYARRDSPMQQDQGERATSSFQPPPGFSEQPAPAYWPSPPEEQDAPAMSQHELTNKLLYVEGWCNDLQENAKVNFTAGIDWTNSQIAVVWEKVQAWDPYRRHT